MYKGFSLQIRIYVPVVLSHSTGNFRVRRNAAIFPEQNFQHQTTMAEVPPEQINTHFGGKPNFFNQTASGSSGSSDSRDNNATGNAQLPKGVVLDKDGKPYVATPILDTDTQYSTIMHGTTN